MGAGHNMRKPFILVSPTAYLWETWLRYLRQWLGGILSGVCMGSFYDAWCFSDVITRYWGFVKHTARWCIWVAQLLNWLALTRLVLCPSVPVTCTKTQSSHISDGRSPCGLRQTACRHRIIYLTLLKKKWLAGRGVAETQWDYGQALWPTDQQSFVLRTSSVSRQRGWPSTERVLRLSNALSACVRHSSRPSGQVVPTPSAAVWSSIIGAVKLAVHRWKLD